MNGRHAICISVDGLRASALGTYGNTISRTPHLDDLASRSVVAECLWADSPTLDGFFHAAWHGMHALRTKQHCAAVPALPELLRQHEVPFRLITDDPQWGELWGKNCQQLAVGDVSSDHAAENIAETAFARFCASSVEHLDQWLDDGAGSVAWIHARGLFGPWDAPAELRSQLLEEDDPPPLDIVLPPDAIAVVDDPDALLLYRTAYAAQVAVIDTCLGALWHAIEEMMSDRETLLMLVGSRGFALGEHDRIGSQCQALFSERLHLPWLVHVCDDQLPRPRVASLTQPADIHATILDWLGIGVPTLYDGYSVLPHLEGHIATHREAALALGEQDEQALLTPSWLLCRTPGDSPQLFTKPDDRWEHNDVAVRCPSEVEELGIAIDQWQPTKSGR